MDHIVYMATAHRGIEENQQPGCWKQLLSTVVMVQSVCVISSFFFAKILQESNPSFLAASSALRLVGELQSFLPPSSYSC